jgi:predicted nucleic acid-binding protein
VSVVVDASVVAAALVDGGADGAWAADLLAGETLAAPALMPVEVASVLRRASAAGRVSGDVASQAHADLLDLRVELFPYAAVAARVWELCHNVTSYDAWYIALAEELGIPLATFDVRLRAAAGLRCAFWMPAAGP